MLVNMDAILYVLVNKKGINTLLIYYFEDMPEKRAIKPYSKESEIIIPLLDSDSFVMNRFSLTVFYKFQ